MKLSIRQEFPDEQSNSTGKKDIIFIHGTGSNSGMWKAQAPFFVKRGHRVTLIDLRGHGETPEPMEETSLDVHLNDLTHTLGEANVKFPAHFVGHSLGAIVAVYLARQKPEWIESILAASLPGKVFPPIVYAFQGFLNGPMQAIAASKMHKHLAWRERTLFEMKPFTLKEIARQFAKLDTRIAIPELRCSVHFATGRFDPIALFWQTMAMKRGLDNSSLKVFEWAGHNFMDARPDEFNDWILACVSRS